MAASNHVPDFAKLISSLERIPQLGHVLNYVSIKERLPTVFMPVSPPPYLNGGTEFLSWVIESTEKDFSPDMAAEWLEGRLPRSVDDPAMWPVNQTKEEQ